MDSIVKFRNRDTLEKHSKLFALYSDIDDKDGRIITKSNN